MPRSTALIRLADLRRWQTDGWPHPFRSTCGPVLLRCRRPVSIADWIRGRGLSALLDQVWDEAGGRRGPTLLN